MIQLLFYIYQKETRATTKKIHEIHELQLTCKQSFQIPPEKRLAKPSPIIDLRVEKNKVERAGMRKSHLKDAVAMCAFLHYMEMQYYFNAEEWDELQVVSMANLFRYEQDNNKGLSFPTIVGYGPHGAMPHYEPNNLTNIKIGNTSTLVVDSGGQYMGVKLQILSFFSARKLNLNLKLKNLINWKTQFILLDNRIKERKKRIKVKLFGRWYDRCDKNSSFRKSDR